MKMQRLILTILLSIIMMFGTTATAFASNHEPVDPDDQGMGGIVGGDTLTFTPNTVWANLTARWGVRVIFRDGDEWNHKEFQNELLPVSNNANADTSSPADPSHSGWTFLGWERVDSNSGPSTLNDDGTVTGINGPGPIIYQAKYTKDEPTPPTDPKKPDKPDTPSTPGNPDTPGTPKVPDKPVVPDTPGVPGAPISPVIPDTPGEPAALQTGDDSHTILWISLLLTSVIGLYVFIVLSKKNKNITKRMWSLFFLIQIGAVAFSCFGTQGAYAAENSDTVRYTYGQYDITYLPGTTDTVTNMPENETGLKPGADTPCTVSSTVPEREGFEFIDWELTWGVIHTEDYIVKYLEYGTGNQLAATKTVSDVEIGAQITECAIPIENYKALAPTEVTIEIIDGENVFIFWYEKIPLLTNYTVYYWDLNEDDIFPKKEVKDVQIGADITETAEDVEGYRPAKPTELTKKMNADPDSNIFIFYYRRNNDDY